MFATGRIQKPLPATCRIYYRPCSSAPGSKTMRLTPTFMIAATILAALAGCGTKTPLTLPPQTPQKASLAPSAAAASVAPSETRNESRP